MRHLNRLKDFLVSVCSFQACLIPVDDYNTSAETSKYDLTKKSSTEQNRFRVYLQTFSMFYIIVMANLIG